MNMESMRIRSYRSFKVDEHVPAVAAGRYRTLKAYDRLRAAGCNESGALEQLGISRRTLYRWPGAEVDPPRPCPPAGLEAQGRQGGDGRAPQVPVHGQGAHPGHAGAQGPPSERVDGRPDHRTRLAVGAIRPDRSGRPRRSATGFSPRAGQAQAAAPLPEGAAFAAVATRWKYGSKACRAGELVQRALARIDPHDLRPWRADAEGVREPKVRPPSVRSRSSW